MLCSFCKQLKKYNESFQEHKRNAEHSNRKQVANLTFLKVSVPQIFWEGTVAVL